MEKHFTKTKLVTEPRELLAEEAAGADVDEGDEASPLVRGLCGAAPVAGVAARKFL